MEKQQRALSARQIGFYPLQHWEPKAHRPSSCNSHIQEERTITLAFRLSTLLVTIIQLEFNLNKLRETEQQRGWTSLLWSELRTSEELQELSTTLSDLKREIETLQNGVIA